MVCKNTKNDSIVMKKYVFLCQNLNFFRIFVAKTIKQCTLV